VRHVTPRPFLFVLTLLLIVGAIVAIEQRFGAASSVDTQATDQPLARAGASDEVPRNRDDDSSQSTGGGTAPEKVQRGGSEERGERKAAEFRQAEEIVAPTGFVNTDGISINEVRGEKVVLVDFWTYSCYNCQNTQPHLNAWHEQYADDGLLIVGVHTPEFGFERELANVERAVREAGIEYPVVLDNNYATWSAYDQRYWPAMYLIDADGFIRYKHFGEGAYEMTEAKIRDLLAEKERISS
jgi:thiol-disulfide isomerase/thioredoxin